MTATNPVRAFAAKSVAADYVHIDKYVTPDDSITLGTSELKWYDVAPKDSPVLAEIKSLARDFLVDQDALGNFSDLGDLGFVILHRCGEDFYFLLVQSWRNENELWESIYAKKSAAHEEFETFPTSRQHKETFCVWELEAVLHEQKAWRTFLRSGRDAAARGNYLNDRFEGIA